MIKQIKQFGNWCKRKILKIAITLGIIGIASAATLTLLPTKIPSIDFNGQTISFPYTDDNSGENLIIRTNSSTTSGIMYVMIENKSGVSQEVGLSAFFGKESQKVKNIKRLKKDVLYQVTIPEYGTTNVIKDVYATSTVNGSTTREVIGTTTETITIQTGSHQETRHKDQWQNQILKEFNEINYYALIKNKAISIKDKRNFKAKERLEELMPDNKISYYKIEFQYPLLGKENHQFFLEVVGSKSAYGHLDPWLSSWNYRKKVSIDPSKIDDDLTNFPAMVALATSTWDNTKIRADNYDVIFTTDDGETLVDFEREVALTTTTIGYYWVEIPSVSSSTAATTTFYMYYGNSGASDGQNATGTWDSNFKAVWHMKDKTTSSTEDSTSNNNDGTKKAANEPIETTGKIAKGQQFDGSNDYINVSGNILQNAGACFVSYWAKYDGSKTSYQAVLGNYNSNNDRWLIYLSDIQTSDERLAFGMSTNGTWQYIAHTGINLGSGGLSDNNWHHIFIYWNGGTTGKIYVDGVDKTSVSNASTNIHNQTSNTYVGDYNSTDFHKGITDELRVSNVSRSIAWGIADYNSGNNSLLTYGSEEEAPSAERRIIITQ